MSCSTNPSTSTDPSSSAGSVVTTTIKSGGSPIPGEFQIYSIEIENGIGRIPCARITFLDGNGATAKFPISSSDVLIPGKEIAIEAGYNSKNTVICSGIVTRQTIEVKDDGPFLVVECKDPAIRMIVGRKSRTFYKQSDSEIIGSIIAEYPGLKAEVTQTTFKWPEQVQHYVTDWDFILALAETNGMVVSVFNGTITVAPPDEQTEVVLDITYGNNLYQISAELDAVGQLGKVKATDWNFPDQKLETSKAANKWPGPGNISSDSLAKVSSPSELELQTTAPLGGTNLKTWAEAQLVKSSYSKIRGEVKFQGSAKAIPGKYIQLKGLGDRFNGKHLISGVTHNIGEGNWFTEARIGLSQEWFTEEPDVMPPPAGGLLPGARGLMNGTVKKIDSDPENQFRILVDLPMLGSEEKGIWARMATFYATADAGVFFLPEEGDEVIVSFLNEDPRFPVILGSLYSGTKHKPFKTLKPEKKNPLKAIVSKSGLYVEFDDENKVLTVMTPGKNQVVLNDKDKKILLKDQHNNSITMDQSGIALKTKSNIKIEAGQKVSIQGKTGIDIETSAGDINLKGLNINEKAQVKYSANGGATAEVKGGATLTLKAAMVMIN